MTIKFVVAAAAAIACAVPSFAYAAEGDTVIKLDRIDANDPAAVQQVLGKIRAAAAQSCSQTGSRIPSHDCVESFVKEAIASVRRAELRVALARAAGEGGGSNEAVTSLPAE